MVKCMWFHVVEMTTAQSVPANVGQVCRMSVMSLWMAYNFFPEKPACRWMNNAMDEMSECGKWRMSARL